MSSSDFFIGQEGELRGGVDYRVRQGRKGPDDLILDIRGQGHWSPACMELGFLMADFFKQNEDRLYPPRYQFRGGSMYLDALMASAERGWRQVVGELTADQERRRQRSNAA